MEEEVAELKRKSEEQSNEYEKYLSEERSQLEKLKDQIMENQGTCQKLRGELKTKTGSYEDQIKNLKRDLKLKGKKIVCQNILQETIDDLNK